MIKGVQHPMRGLFLRNYLTTVSKNKLPDIGSPYEGTGGNVQDAVNFILQNFAETNRLWVRLQTQGASKDKKKREKERMDLRILVGTNLVRLSQLEGLDVQEYKTSVLPKILEEVISCKDTIAQSYLMDCVIQVFPDEFHLATLEPFLLACPQLKERVNVRSILEALMTRLGKHVTSTGGQLPPDMPIFKLFNDCVTTLIETRTNMSLTETLRLQTVLSNFALDCYPTKMEYVTHCMQSCNALIDKTDFATQSAAANAADDKAVSEATAQIEALLSAPLKTLGLRVLEIPAYSKLMSYMPWNSWRQVASSLLRSVLAMNATLSEVEQVEQLLNAITPLLKCKDGSVWPTDEDGRELPPTQTFKEEQHLVARCVHLMKNDDTDVLMQLYAIARSHFTNGGAHRVQFTCAPLVFACLSLTRRVFKRERAAERGEESPPTVSTRKVFQFCIEMVTAVATSHPEQAMRLFLQSAQAADECGFHAIAYEFVKEALELYGQDITDSKAQVRALTAVISTLLNCKNFPAEDYEALITKVAQYANKLLKKPDQCRMVTLSSHLFWPKSSSSTTDGTAVAAVGERYSNPERVLECLQRSLKIASVCNPNLYVEILDRYVYYYETENPAIQVRYLSGLIKLINEQLGVGEQGQANPAVEAHYRNTLDYVRSRQQGSETAERFAQVEL